jgi:deoxycytidylate deaminase
VWTLASSATYDRASGSRKTSRRLGTCRRSRPAESRCASIPDARHLHVWHDERASSTRATSAIQLASRKPESLGTSKRAPDGVLSLSESRTPTQSESEQTDLARRVEEQRELVIAFVRPIGAEVDPIIDAVRSHLATAGYGSEVIHLADLLAQVDVKGYLRATPAHVRYRTHMDLGDHLRFISERKDAVALLGVLEIIKLRRERLSNPPAVEHHRGWAYLIRSVMRREEVLTLRQIYGPRLFVISVFASHDDCSSALKSLIAKGTGQDTAVGGSIAEALMARDAGLATDPATGVDLHQDVKRDPEYPCGRGFGVDVGSTFELADVFVSATNIDESRRTIERFIDLVFSYPFHTPKLDEMGMYIAFGYSLRSASLSRRVGAAILNHDGDVIAVGTNEVPRFKGGLYWAEQLPDYRDFRIGHDPNDRAKRRMLTDILARLRANGWLRDALTEAPDRRLDEMPIDDLTNLALKSEAVRSSRALDVIEYGRTVHAEMAAITDAARRGASVRGTTMYSTTFSCHDCAKHIIAAGIERVVHIEAYPKSRVQELFEHEIGLVERVGEVGDRVRFEPFIGISPHRFDDLFSLVPRKKSDEPSAENDDLSGDVVAWKISEAPERGTVMSRREDFGYAHEGAIFRAEARAAGVGVDTIAKYQSRVTAGETQ